MASFAAEIAEKSPEHIASLFPFSGSEDSMVKTLLFSLVVYNLFPGFPEEINGIPHAP